MITSCLRYRSESQAKHAIMAAIPLSLARMQLTSLIGEQKLLRPALS